MTKTKFALTVIQLAIAVAGVYLINDIKVVGGVFMLMWANNFDFAKKDQVGGRLK